MEHWIPIPDFSALTCTNIYTWTLRMVPHLGSASPLTVLHMSGCRFLKYGCSSFTSYSWQRGYESYDFYWLTNLPVSIKVVHVYVQFFQHSFF